jgi:hypothetical protein
MRTPPCHAHWHDILSSREGSSFCAFFRRRVGGGRGRSDWWRLRRGGVPVFMGVFFLFMYGYAMHVWVCLVYVCIRFNVCMHGCVSVCVCMHVFMRVWVYVGMGVCTDMYVFFYACMHTYVCMYIRMH